MKQGHISGGLYLVPSPLGNLADLTSRAVEVLKSADLIMAEDTRRSLKLLNHLQLRKSVLSYREQNHKRAWPKIAETLASGGVVALLTDAGAPSVSDPGAALAAAASESGFEVIPLPGPSAVICALMASGFSADRFTFAGFLPAKSGERRSFISALARHPWTLVFFETPHRLAASLADLADIFQNRPALVAREMTKLHEEYLRGSLPELAEELAANPRKGEFTIVVAGCEGDKPKKRSGLPAGGRLIGDEPKTPDQTWTLDNDELDLDRLKETALNDPRPTKVLAAAVAEAGGRRRSEIYKLLLDFRRDQGER